MNLPLPLLWVFAKWPEPGAVKTRLCPPLSPQQAADLARAFLEDRVDSLRSASGLEGGIAYAPAAAGERFREAFPGARRTPQGEGELGERMARVVRESLAERRPAVLLVGSDVPLLPISMAADAARALASGGADLVLTPAPDGGYSMIGMSRFHGELFEEMEWSTPQILPETLRRAGTLGLKVHLTEPVSDCDTPDDLRALFAAYEAGPERFREAALRTAAVLERFRPLLRGSTTPP
ncbi:MAG: TIGR04282 family arsenosugar biosynthesis glycosyltransferase [Armatimonadetes bacterium]|nr:TIGR04282 family arsenosugar biosynthesis glycosyltransferase [Armatimonadota bacterium]